MVRTFVGGALLLGLSGLGCGDASQSQPATAATPAGPSAGGSQVERGANLYADNCASCHGAGGEGSANAPPVVGAAALPLDPRPTQKYRKVQFDVAQWVVKYMPPKAGGSLKEDEYWAIMAFDLKANGVDVTGKTVDATAAQAIVLHP